MEIVECTRVFVHALFLLLLLLLILLFLYPSVLSCCRCCYLFKLFFVFAVIVVSFHVVVVVGKVLVYHDSSQLESKILFSKSGMILAHWK